VKVRPNISSYSSIIRQPLRPLSLGIKSLHIAVAAENDVRNEYRTSVDISCWCLDRFRLKEVAYVMLQSIRNPVLNDAWTTKAFPYIDLACVP